MVVLIASRDASHWSVLGTGTLLAPARVLTAFHVVHDGQQISSKIVVRRQGTDAFFEATVAWQNAETDVAVLECDGLGDPQPSYPLLSTREIQPGEEWEAQGYAAVVAKAPGADMKPFGGATRGYYEGQRDLSLDTPIPPDAWGGLSGAAAVVKGRIVGIVRAKEAGFGNKRLSARSVAAFLYLGGFRTALGLNESDFANLHREESTPASPDKTAPRPLALPILIPDFHRPFKRPAHLTTYLERRLGIAHSRKRRGDESTDGSPARSSQAEAWTESPPLRDIEYEDRPELNVLGDLAAAVGKTSRFWMIQGEPGSGKSMLLEHWVERWLDALASGESGSLAVPVLVQFRYLNDEAVDADEEALPGILWDKATLINVRQRFPGCSLARGDIVPVWFLDGWDEASPRLQSDEFLDRLAGVPGPKLFTCRTSVLADLKRTCRWSKYFDAKHEYTVRDLNSEEQRALLFRHFGDTAPMRSLHAGIQHHRQLRFIAASPLILAFLAEMADKSEGDVLLPASRAQFYELAVQRSWKRLGGEAPRPWDAIARDQALERLAGSRALSEGSFSWGELSASLEAAGVTRRDDQLQLAQWLERSGLLRKEGERYDFVHRTFQEYFFARALKGGFEKALRAHWHDRRFDETLVLLGAIDSSDDEHAVDSALVRFMNWGFACHEANPKYLLREIQRSPLRYVMHFVRQAGMEERLPRTTAVLLEAVKGSAWVQYVAFCQGKEPAASELTPSRQWEETKRLQEAVAWDERAPLNLRIACLEGASKLTRLDLATDTICSELLQELARFLRGSEVLSLARNPSCPAELLQALSSYDFHHRDRLRAAVAGNPNSSADLLRVLARDDDQNVRRYLAANASCPVDLLEELARSPFEWVRGSVAGNASCPEALLRCLARDHEAEVRGAAACNPRCPSDVLAPLVKDTDTDVRCLIAGNTSVPDLLRIFSQDSCPEVRQALVYNRHCPESILEEFARAGSAPVRRTAARSTGCPTKWLERLSEDLEEDVRRGAASNPSCPELQLRRLAGDPRDSVREAVAGNPSCPEDSLRRLAKDGDEGVRIGVATNPACSPDLLHELAKDSEKVSLAVARNPNALLESL